MNKRLLKIADMLFPAPNEHRLVTQKTIDVVREFAKCSPRQKYPKENDMDLKAEDLSNRLEEAISAIGDCVTILTELGMAPEKAEEKIFSIVKSEICEAPNDK